MRYVWMCVLVLGLCVGCGDEDDSGPTETSLSADVMPVFDARCAGCHTRTDAPFEDATVNGTYLENKDDVLGMVGTFIQAGDSSNSGIVAVITQEMAVGEGPTMMPPPDLAPAMPASEVAIIKSWIDQGAKDN